MNIKHFAVLFALICGTGTSALAQQGVVSILSVTQIPANAETLLSVKAENLRQGWKVSVNDSEARTGPTVFSLGNNTQMVRLNVQAAPSPDGKVGFKSTSIEVEVRKFQETVVVLKRIPLAPAATAATPAAAASAVAQARSRQVDGHLDQFMQAA